MNKSDVIRSWSSILRGDTPALSIEITKECPLNCAGCYAYDPAHLDGDKVLEDLSDYQKDELVQGVLSLVEKFRPLHLSIVGGDPLVRFRELEILLPQLDAMGINVQLVTSAFRSLPECAPLLPKLDVVVSIDGLQPEHDVRRKPATYERILRNIQGQKITVHCTVTGEMIRNCEGYLDNFLHFWSERPEVKRIWMSILTPQQGEVSALFPTWEERKQIVVELLVLRQLYPKLDMVEEVIEEFLHPPQSPKQCIFAQSTRTISADLKTLITPCQFGGKPDCSKCGCIASMGLAAVGHKSLKDAHPLLPNISLSTMFQISRKVGRVVQFFREDS